MKHEHHYTPMQRVDRYLRRENTSLARFARAWSPDVGHDYLRSWQKRWLVDVPMGLAGGGLTSLALVPLAIIIKLEDRGPVFYKHERMGGQGETVNVWKLRSMRQDADRLTPAEIDRINHEYGPAGDPRNTKIGSILRRYELDELPQFWQVVKGDFSLCGIRVMHPHFRENMARYVDPRDMERWDEAYSRNRGVYNPNASRGSEHRKDDKKRVHDDLLYDRKASLGFDYYLLMVTALRMLEIVKKRRSEKSA